jgi:hypothetical protein
MDLSKLCNEDLEYYYVTKYGNIIESNGPHDTQMVIHNPNRQVSYFDMEPVLLILSNIKTDYNVDYRSDIYTFYGTIDSFNYRITINLESSLLEFINSDINVSHNFQTVDIPEVKYPIYQYTSNPAIVITAALVAGCYVAFSDSNYIMGSIDYLCDKIEDDENYYIDESIILILSIYVKKVWYQQKDIMNIISIKINETTEILTELEMQKMNNLKNDNISFSSLNTRIKILKTLLRSYIHLEEITKTLKPTDEIMELKLGKHSHFLVRRHGNIMTINRNEFNTIQLENIYEYLQELYDNIHNKFISVTQDFNEYSIELPNNHSRTIKKDISYII